MQKREPTTGMHTRSGSQEATAAGGSPAKEFRFDTLGDDDNVVYCLSADLRLTYMNPSWCRFARDNGGESVIERFGIGTSILDAITGPLRDFYAQAYARALASMKVWEHDYECSSITTYRVFHQAAYPLRDGSGLVVMNSLAVTGAMPAQPAEARSPLMRDYCDASGLITQCSHCRRVQRADASGRWESGSRPGSNAFRRTPATACAASALSIITAAPPGAETNRPHNGCRHLSSTAHTRSRPRGC